MARVHRYLRERDGVFQYERRVPQLVVANPEAYEALFGSRRLFRVSLRTKDPAQMPDAYASAHASFEARKAKAQGRHFVRAAEPAAKPITLRKVVDADLERIAERYSHLTAEPFERLHRIADSNPAAAAELARMEANLADDAEEIARALKERGDQQNAPILLPIEEARHVAAAEAYDAPEGSPSLGSIAMAVRVGMERGYQRVTGLDSSQLLPALRPGPNVIETAPTITIRDAVTRHLAARGKATKTESETRLSLAQFESVIGNKQLDQIVRGDVNAFLEHLASQKVGGSRGSIARPLSEPTIKKRLGRLNAATGFAIDRGWYDGRNPFTGVKVGAFAKRADKAIMPSKRGFQLGELNRIFEHPWFTGCRSSNEKHLPGTHRLQGSEFWVPVVALFTGCRAGELGGLRLAEVRLDDPFPHIVVRDNQYRGTKGGYSRCVPILDALLELGFAEYLDRVRQAGADRLFPDWTARSPSCGGFPAWSNAKLIRAFNRTVVPATLKDTLIPHARREVTFHAFRGSFKAMLGSRESGVPINFINEVIGHAKSDLDARYVGTIPLQETYEAVRGCRYRGLFLPTRPSAT